MQICSITLSDLSILRPRKSFRLPPCNGVMYSTGLDYLPSSGTVITLGMALSEPLLAQFAHILHFVNRRQIVVFNTGKNFVPYGHIPATIYDSFWSRVRIVDECFLSNPFRMRYRLVCFGGFYHRLWTGSLPVVLV